MRVQEILRACTDDDPESDDRSRENWRRRKERYLEDLRSAPPDALLVSCADKLHNARSIVRDLSLVGEGVWDRFNAPKEDQLWYYRRLVAAFRSLGLEPVWLVDELKRLVAAMDSEETE